MNILVLIGSYRRHGNTDQLIGLVKEHLQKEAAEAQVPFTIETVFLGQENLQFCRGCRICFDRGEINCPIKDNLLVVKAKMQAADGILLASPVYVDDVSGITKNFIDRMGHVCHRPEFASKVAYLVATTGSSRTGKTLATMQLALHTWGVYIAGQSGYKMGALMNQAQIREKFTLQTAQIAHRFFQSVNQKSYLAPSFFSLMMFKIQQMSWQKHDPDTIDYQYWREKGWFEPKRTFYIPHSTGWFKVALARFTGLVIGKFMA